VAPVGRRARRAALALTRSAGGPDATERALAAAASASAVILVEGLSDQLALEALAAHRALDLPGAGIAIVPIGGAHAIGRFLVRFAGRAALAGICDAGEEPVFRRALERAGVDSGGFHVCIADLEDELIRALGVDAVRAVVEAGGDLAPLRTFERQPAWEGRPPVEQLHRFIRSSSRRNLRYARLLAAAAAEAGRIPAPLAAVLTTASPRRA
jgi:OLD-like protein